MTTELESTQIEINKLRERESELRGAKFISEIVPKLKLRVGKTFVFRGNSYGSDRAKWDTFRKLIKVVVLERHAWLIFEKFQIAEGRAEITSDFDLADYGYEGHGYGRERWEECSEMEYDQMREAVMRELADPVMYIATFGK
jgi:hypothetical protein